MPIKKPKQEDLTDRENKLLRLLIWNAVDAELEDRKRRTKFTWGMFCGAKKAITTAFDLNEKTVVDLINSLADIQERFESLVDPEQGNLKRTANSQG